MNREEKIFLLIAHDIVALKESFLVDNYRLIYSMLYGDRWTQYFLLPDSMIDDDFESCKNNFNSEVSAIAEKLKNYTWPS